MVTKFAEIEALLFDFDGTLIQQSIDFALMRRTVLEIIARYGMDPEPLAEMFSLEAIALVEQQLDGGEQGRGRAFAAQARQAILDIELQAAEGAYAFPGVPEMLHCLRQGNGARRSIKVGIVTRNCRQAVERVLERNAMAYDVLLTRDDTPHVKPDPRHLLEALAILGVPGSRAMMCGDHPTDVLVGKKVGALTVGVLPAGRQAGYFAEVQPDLLVATVTEILPYLGVCEQPTGGA